MKLVNPASEPHRMPPGTPGFSTGASAEPVADEHVDDERRSR